MKKAKRLGIIVLVAFAVIAFWRGLWGLIDLYLFPENPALRYWASLIIGFLVLMVTDYLEKEF